MIRVFISKRHYIVHSTSMQENCINCRMLACNGRVIRACALLLYAAAAYSRTDRPTPECIRHRFDHCFGPAVGQTPDRTAQNGAQACREVGTFVAATAGLWFPRRCCFKLDSRSYESPIICLLAKLPVLYVAMSVCLCL